MSTDERDFGGLITAAVMVAGSGWVFWESREYTELAAAFPRAVSLVMAAVSIALILRCLLRLQRRPVVEGGSPLRRGALFLVLAGWVALIPVAGFFLASFLGFVASGIAARYERWPMRRWAGFVCLAQAIVAVFYGLFAKVLLVPFPQGPLS